jgi:hypothetical protein
MERPTGIYASTASRRDLARRRARARRPALIARAGGWATAALGVGLALTVLLHLT